MEGERRSPLVGEAGGVRAHHAKDEEFAVRAEPAEDELAVIVDVSGVQVVVG